jgi:hypothetical protein
MQEKLNEYQAKFTEPFPLMLVMGHTDEEITEIIQQCLDEGKTYEPEEDPNTVI